jgi:hypothetical protein
MNDLRLKPTSNTDQIFDFLLTRNVSGLEAIRLGVIIKFSMKTQSTVRLFSFISIIQEQLIVISNTAHAKEEEHTKFLIELASGLAALKRGNKDVLIKTVLDLEIRFKGYLNQFKDKHNELNELILSANGIYVFLMHIHIDELNHCPIDYIKEPLEQCEKRRAAAKSLIELVRNMTAITNVFLKHTMVRLDCLRKRTTLRIEIHKHFTDNLPQIHLPSYMLRSVKKCVAKRINSIETHSLNWAKGLYLLWTLNLNREVVPLVSHSQLAAILKNQSSDFSFLQDHQDKLESFLLYIKELNHFTINELNVLIEDLTFLRDLPLYLIETHDIEKRAENRYFQHFLSHEVLSFKSKSNTLSREVGFINIVLKEFIAARDTWMNLLDTPIREAERFKHDLYPVKPIYKPAAITHFASTENTESREPIKEKEQPFVLSDDLKTKLASAFKKPNLQPLFHEVWDHLEDALACFNVGKGIDTFYHLGIAVEQALTLIGFWHKPDFKEDHRYAAMLDQIDQKVLPLSFEETHLLLKLSHFETKCFYINGKSYLSESVDLKCITEGFNIVLRILSCPFKKIQIPYLKSSLVEEKKKETSIHTDYLNSFPLEQKRSLETLLKQHSQELQSKVSKELRRSHITKLLRLNHQIIEELLHAFLDKKHIEITADEFSNHDIASLAKKAGIKSGDNSFVDSFLINHRRIRHFSRYYHVKRSIPEIERTKNAFNPDKISFAPEKLLEEDLAGFRGLFDYLVKHL